MHLPIAPRIARLLASASVAAAPRVAPVDPAPTSGVLAVRGADAIQYFLTHTGGSLPIFASTTLSDWTSAQSCRSTATSIADG